MPASVSSPTRAAPLHRYSHLQLVLRKRILTGTYPPRSMLPGERELAEEFAVARVTVRSALQALQREGLVARRPSRGTVVTSAVAAPSAPPSRDAFEALFDSIMDVGMKTRVQVLALGFVAASPEVARALALTQSEPTVLRAVRVRVRAGQPFSYSEAFVPAAFAAGITRRSLASQPLLALLARQGVCVDRAEERIGATEADLEVAPALQVPVGAALLQVRRTIFDVQGRAVELFLGQFRPERYHYHLTTSHQPSNTRVRVAAA